MALPGRAEVIEAIKPITDPEINISLVELGLVYNVEVEPENNKALVEMTLTSPGCPVGPQILAAVKKAVQDTGYEGVEVKLVWEPKWDPNTMASDEAKDALGIW